MVEYIRSDLEAILFHIKIAEAHAAGRSLYGPDPDGPGPLLPGLIPTYNLSWGLRTVDGSYNNLLPGQEYWGAANQPFTTHIDPVYRTFQVDMGPTRGGVQTMDYTPTLVDPDGAGRAVAGDVYDPAVRTISNLIADQTLANPAAIMESMRRDGIQGDLLAIALEVKAAYEAHAELVKTGAPAQDIADAKTVVDRLLVTNGIELDGDNIILPNVATDEGLSAPFNSWFTLFGQFFDHGLDLVNKGGSGTVFIPLAKDDPLYNPGPDGVAGNADDPRTNFMVMTRATTGPGADGVFGTADDVRPLNTTTPFVDQNQTYSSHPSHQVFLREYEPTATGPKATGKLIEGRNGGMANWGELKQYTSEHLGIRLLDSDVGSVPLLRTDPYGNFIAGPNGFPQVILGVGSDGIPNTADDIVIEGDPDANGGQGVDISMAIRTTSMFLADIAHHAAPNGVADSDSALGLDNLGASNAGTYDNELLDKHFIAGDGRVNENIGLITVHHIFHAEHNRMAEHTKTVILADAQKLLAEGASEAEAIAFLNEWLDVAVTAVPTSMAGLDWNGERVFQAAKFGTEMQYQHLVFEEFARKIQPAINVFIVPDGYDATINPSIMAEFAHVVYRFGHSMLTESVDRFSKDSFTPDHISLIAAFLNPVEFDAGGTISDSIGAGDIVRGMTRQTGAQIDEFVTSALRDNLLGLPLDLATINLARGRDTGTPSLNAARREFFEVTNNNPALRPYESWADFAAHLKNEASIINFVAAYGTHTLITSQMTIEGKRNAALTIITGESFGGLEVPADAVDFLNATGAFAGGKLGGLEDVDLWIGGLAEQTMPFGGMLGSTFNFVFEVQMESLQNGDRFYYLQRNTGQHLFEQLEANSLASMVMRHTDATHLPADIFSNPGLILEVIRSRQFNDLNGDGLLESDDPTSGNLLTQLVIRDNPATAGVDTNYLRYTGAEHVVLGGTDDADTLIAGMGDDTVHGDAGNDRIEGGFGNDELRGGDGDDIITDMGGDDTLKGGKGNDAINGGSGIDLVLAGDGNDFVVMGSDGDGGAFGGLGNDFMLMNLNSLPAFGNEGDDWIEDGANAGMFGDNLDDGFARDAIRGNDVMVGVGGGFDEYVGEGGDDIMVGSLGSAKHAGMSGFDWVTYKNLTAGIDASLLDDFIFDEAPVDPADIALQRFESVEGLSGTHFDDRLTGSDFTAADRVPGGPDHAFLGSLLDAQGIALINGLQEVLGAGVTSFSAGDILLGGDGNDEIVGGGGDDIIDGDKWLNVRISVREKEDGTGAEIATADSMTELTTRIFNGTINPGQLVIVREIKSDATNVTGEFMNVDTARYSGARADYDVVTNLDGTVTVTHARGTLADGTDTLRNIEELQFLDQRLVLSGPNFGRAPALDLNGGVAGTGFTASFTEDGLAAAIAANVGISDLDSTSMAGARIRLTNAQALDVLSIDGALPATITSSLSPIVDGVMTLTLTGSASLADYQTAIQAVRYATTSQNPVVTPRTIEVTVNDGLTDSALAVSTVNVVAVNDAAAIDLNASVAGTGSISTFTEDGAAAAIGAGAAITDVDSTNIVSAQVRLTNAQEFDVLSVGVLPLTITSALSPIVDGVMTLTLTGTASLAEYQTAIQAVRYATTSQNPVVTPRIIEVTVNDGNANSVAAIATVNVAAVNDAPVAFADAVITNSTAAFIIPEWALLANDTDVDGNVLDVTAVRAAVGVTLPSLLTNPGSVTLADDATPGGSFTYTASDGALTSNAAITLTRQGMAQVADNFDGAGPVRSSPTNSTGTTRWTGNGWVEAQDGTNVITAGQIQIDGGNGNGSNQLRFLSGDGAQITRAVDLSGASAATLTFLFDKNGIDVGEWVKVQFSADGSETGFVDLEGGLITNTNGTTASGNATGTISLALPGTFGTTSAIRFVGSRISTAGEDIRIDNLRIDYAVAAAPITGTAAGEILIGNDVGSSLNGLGGNDLIFAGGGDDTISWSVGDGRDFVDGGGNDGDGDRFVVNGNAQAEAYVVYARADVPIELAAGLNVNTEIVITRNGEVIAELDNVEEITINTAGGVLAGVDSVAMSGNFDQSSLFFNTVTVNGGPGTTIDASKLTSAHKLVLNQGGSPMPAPTTVVADDFVNSGQLFSDVLVRSRLFAFRDDLFAGSRPFDSLGAGHFIAGGLHGNSTFGRGQGFNFSFNDFEYAATQLEPGLRLEAADYLIG